MRIGSRFLSAAFAMLFLSITSPLYAQEADTFKSKPFDTFWTRQRFVPKLGAGAQDRAFLEVGLIWQNIYKHPFSLASKGPYFTIDVFIDESNLLLGPKLGYEFTAGVFGVAGDFTYFIDHNYDKEGNNREALVATPKIGLTILGFANLFYGYQIPLSDQRITSITRNRFSLTFNLNKDYFDLKGAPRKKP